MAGDDIRQLAEQLNKETTAPGDGTYLRRATVVSVSGSTATITIGGATIAGVPFYNFSPIKAGDAVDVLFDGPTPRILGALAAPVMGMVKISEFMLASNGTISFDPIPQNFSTLKIIGSVRQGSSVQIGMRFNNGAGTQSYDNTTWQAQFGSGVVARGSAVNQGRAFCGDTTPDTAAGNGYSNIETTIPDYSQTRPKHVHTNNWGGIDDNHYDAGHNSRFYDLAPITAILVSHFDGTALGVGTHLTLYGLT